MRRRKQWLATAALLLLGPAPALAAPCTPGSLSAYIALGSSGCTIQAQSPPYTDLLVKDFAFSVLSQIGGPATVSAAGVSVTPYSGADWFSLGFASAGFSATAGQAVTYELSYLIDPPPPVIHEFELEMSAESPVFPGSATITAYLCVGSAFVAGLCPGTPMSLSVFHAGTSMQLFNSVSFSGTNVLGVRNSIALDAVAGGSADFAGFSNTSVPEPGSVLLVAGGLAALARRRRRALKASQVLFQFPAKTGRRLAGLGSGQQL